MHRQMDTHGRGLGGPLIAPGDAALTMSMFGALIKLSGADPGSRSSLVHNVGCRVFRIASVEIQVDCLFHEAGFSSPVFEDTGFGIWDMRYGRNGGRLRLSREQNPSQGLIAGAHVVVPALLSLITLRWIRELSTPKIRELQSLWVAVWPSSRS